MRVILTDAQNELIRHSLELTENSDEAETLIGLFETAEKIELIFDEEHK